MKFIILLCLIASTVICAADFSSATYQAQSRVDKSNQLWSAVTANKESGDYPSTLGLTSIFTESMDVSINYKSDSLPQGRKKLIHSVGVVAKVEFVAEPNTPYTGLFQGADSAFIRFSLAKKPDYSNPSASKAYDNFTPGFGLKFLIDGKPSANLVAMHGVNGVNSFNFFDQDMSNHIPGAQGVPLTLVAQKFSSATSVIQNVGLKSFSESNQNGSTVTNAKFPFKLTFRAPSDIKNKFTNDFTEEYDETFSTFPAGTTILDVFATEDPATGCEKKIGTLKTTSTFTTSKFGDEGLFFQHQDFNLDLKVNSQWTDFTPFWSLLGNRNAKKPEGKCPFASLFE